MDDTMIALSWVTGAAIVALILIGAGTLVASLAAMIESALEKLKRPPPTTVGDMIAREDIASALEAFTDESENCQAVIVLWVDADGQVRIVTGGLADLEKIGLLAEAQRHLRGE
jgi:hypothetical protein